MAGRPKKGEEKNTGARVAFRLTEDQRLALDTLAAAHGRSLTDEVRVAIDEHLRRHAGR